MITSLQRQRGTVLVTVLMMFAIAAFLAAEMAYRQKLDVRRTSAMLMSEQAREYLLGAEALARLALKDDFKADKKDNSKFIDSLDEEWARKRPPFPVEGGYIQGEIIDAQSKFNINDLVDASGKTDSTQAKIGKHYFIELLKQLDIPKEGSPETVYQMIVDWIDPNPDEIGPDGREDGAYLRAKRPYRTANRVILDISELRYIDGMDLETFNKLAPHLVALPPGTPKNLNTLDKMLMSMMSQDAAGLQTERESGGIDDSDIGKYAPNWADLKTSPILASPSPPVGGGSFDQDDLNEMFTVKSDYFELLAKAEVGGRVVYSKSLIYRYPDGGRDPEKSGKLKVIYRAYIDPLQQPMTQPANAQSATNGQGGLSGQNGSRFN